MGATNGSSCAQGARNSARIDGQGREIGEIKLRMNELEQRQDEIHEKQSLLAWQVGAVVAILVFVAEGIARPVMAHFLGG